MKQNRRQRQTMAASWIEEIAKQLQKIHHPTPFGQAMEYSVHKRRISLKVKSHLFQAQVGSLKRKRTW